MSQQSLVGIVLSGGGSRGAYQAGVLHGLSEVAREMGVENPFPIMTGISAGAINSCFMASQAHQFYHGAQKLTELWGNLTPEKVFRTDPVTLGRIGFRWFSSLSLGGLSRKVSMKALLDTKPLHKLLSENIDFTQIQKNIETGHLRATAISATHYTTSSNITFVMGNDSVPMWHRVKRKSERVLIQAEHIMASAAIPLFFPPIQIEEKYYGDGCLRNTTPLSPAIHLGAQKLVLVGVRKSVPMVEVEVAELLPTPARVLSVLLNSVFLDGADIDYERLSRINQTLSILTEEQRKKNKLHPIECLWIRPSEDLGQIAKQYASDLPSVIRYLVRGLGSYEEASEVISYILFDSKFCSRLIELGHRDVMQSKESIKSFLSTP